MSFPRRTLESLRLIDLPWADAREETETCATWLRAETCVTFLGVLCQPLRREPRDRRVGVLNGVSERGRSGAQVSRTATNGTWQATFMNAADHQPMRTLAESPPQRQEYSNV